MIYFECVVIVCVLICLGFGEGTQAAVVYCWDDVDVVVGVVGVWGVHVVDAGVAV